MTVAPRETSWPRAASVAPSFQRAFPLLLTFSLVLTGASGLIYQVVWFRTLGLTFGVTVQATSAVLAAFMAGLAIGSLLMARYGGRIANPLRAYAVAEIVIGLAGFASLWALDALQPLYRWFAMTVTDSLPVLTTARFALAFLIMLIPTTLMGATLPLVVKATALRSGFAASHVGLLYAGNTAGAIAGAFFAGFYLIGLSGLTTTTAIAATLNLAVGVAWLGASRGKHAASTERPRAAVSASRDAAFPPPLVGAVVAVYGLSGFIALAYEVVWVRVLAGIFPGTVYAFTLMLCAILFGIAAGSWLISPLLHRRWNWPLIFAALEGLLGLLGLLSIAVLANAYSIERTVRAFVGQRDPLLGEPWFMAGFGLVALGPAALVMGALFPVAAKIVGTGHPDAGRRVGLVYGANVLGAIAGSLAGGLILIPLLGAQRTLWLLAAGNLLAGAAVLAFAPAPLKRKAAFGGAAAAVALAAALLTPDLYGTLFATIPWNERTIWYHEGQDATVRVADSLADGTRVLYINSEHQGTDRGSGLQFHYRLGHLGSLLHPEPRDVLVIGMGVGATPGAAALYPESRVRVVELYPGVVEAARLFRHINYDVHRRPNVAIEVNDGRNFLLLSRQKFDVIQADPILPTNAGAANLYSTDYYKLARSALNDDGLMVQWLTNTLPGAAYRMLLRSFLDAFPYATLWHNGAILVGSPQPIVPDPEAIARKFNHPELRQALAALGYTNASEVLRDFTAGPDDLWAFAGAGPQVTDRFPAVEYIRTVPFEGPGATPQWARAARYIELRQGPNDGIVYGAGDVRERLREYYRGTLSEFILPPTVEGRERALEADLRRFAEGKEGIWLVPWWQSDSDVLAEAVLNGSAYLIADRWLGGVRVLRYAGPASLPLRPADVSFGDTVRLRGWGIEREQAAAGEAVRVALEVEAQTDIRENIKASLRLVDRSGRVLAEVDRLPRNAPIEEWRRGQRVVDRIGLLIPPGTPAGDYRLDLTYYREATGGPLPAAGGDAAGRVTLASFTVLPDARPFPAGAIEANTPLIVRYGPAQLVGYSLSPATRRPGDLVPVTLFWQPLDRAARPPARLLFGDPSAPLTAATLPAGSAREPGTIERVDLALRIPPTAAAGRYGVWLIVEQAGSAPLRLGTVPLIPWPPLPAPAPPALAVGARFGDIATLDGLTAQRDSAGLLLDLVWTPERDIARSYLVFVHALDAEGRIVAQSDRVPADGAAPTTSWVPGRQVGDRHRLALAPPADGAIAIGLYDPLTGERVAVGGESAVRLPPP
ncbi:MAG: fused MFS/spermidine synthase [Chloroflexota bacterium]|nr:fused MFS/spermidine synthase [Dehalococcoidia bacterium]MDW8253968.1 fused MFS/spermidine synthase [Chloroflexota bacterium]